MSPRFPSRDLRPRVGSIGAMLFENPHTDLARDVFWRVEIDFEPIEYRNGLESETFRCNAQVEWMKLGLRDWKGLEGREILSGGDQPFEATFYTTEHDWSDETRLSFRDRNEASFALDLGMSVAFSGWYEADSDPAMPVSATLRVPFEGLMIGSKIVMPAPGNEAMVLDVARPFVDLDAYGAPELRTNEFGVAAWWLPPRTASRPP